MAYAVGGIAVQMYCVAIVAGVPGAESEHGGGMVGVGILAQVKPREGAATVVSLGVDVVDFVGIAAADVTAAAGLGQEQPAFQVGGSEFHGIGFEGGAFPGRGGSQQYAVDAVAVYVYVSCFSAGVGGRAACTQDRDFGRRGYAVLSFAGPEGHVAVDLRSGGEGAAGRSGKAVFTAELGGFKFLAAALRGTEYAAADDEFGVAGKHVAGVGFPCVSGYSAPVEAVEGGG